MKKLVVYYSLSNGNTKRIAKQIAQSIDADLAEIETVEPYTGNYNAIVDQGQREVNAGFQPAIKPLKKNLEDYDEIIVGTPTWWYTMAPAVLTFLSGNDFSNKKLSFFQTHGGWPGSTLEDMAKKANAKTIKHSFGVQFDSNGGDHLVSKSKEIQKNIEQL
jgi:flavodoxin